MKNREKKEEILRINLKKCVPSWGTAYVCGNIPIDIRNNAIATYASSALSSEVIGLIDTTIFGSGKKGMLFTETGYYYRTDTSSGYYKYSDRQTWRSFSDYNVDALNYMLEELYKADKYKSVTERIGDLDNTITTLDETFEKIGRGANTVIGWIEKLNQWASSNDDNTDSDKEE